jgi:hypothetical protein
MVEQAVETAKAEEIFAKCEGMLDELPAKA